MPLIELSRSVGVIGVGYEGREINEFAGSLRAAGVDRLVDVRLTPISRKRGFSKNALRITLEAVGIDYEHCPELGNPKANRPGFAGDTDNLSRARAAYRECLATDAARETIARLRAIATRERVVLLCFEANQSRCHRDVLLEMMAAVQRSG